MPYTSRKRGGFTWENPVHSGVSDFAKSSKKLGSDVAQKFDEESSIGKDPMAWLLKMMGKAGAYGFKKLVEQRGGLSLNDIPLRQLGKFRKFVKLVREGKINTSKLQKGQGQSGGFSMTDLIEMFFKWLKGDVEQDQEAPPEEKKQTRSFCDRFLDDHGIDSRRDFRKWSLKNHPDREGDSETFARVSDCMDKTGRGQNGNKSLREMGVNI